MTGKAARAVPEAVEAAGRRPEERPAQARIPHPGEAREETLPAEPERRRAQVAAEQGPVQARTAAEPGQRQAQVAEPEQRQTAAAPAKKTRRLWSRMPWERLLTN